MPGVEGQWDFFYPNLRLKIKHTLSACGTFYAKSHRYKKYATTTIMSQITNAKPNSEACTQALSGGAKEGGGSRDTCPVLAVPRQLAGR